MGGIIFLGGVIFLGRGGSGSGNNFNIYRENKISGKIHTTGIIRLLLHFDLRNMYLCESKEVERSFVVGEKETAIINALKVYIKSLIKIHILLQ